MPSDLDKAFELIEKGRDQEKNGKQWEAAESFGHAMMLLEKLANSTPCDDKEQAKIAELYRTKSREYRHYARECLIQALKVVKDAETEQPLSDDEAQQRLYIFSILFSKPIQEKDVTEKTSALEERLMELNASLPSGFKTSSERMADINRGLNRLGLSLYSHSDHKKDDIPELSADEQVDQIIAQAKDEVMHGARKDEPATTTDIADIDDLTSSDSEDESLEDSDIESSRLKNKKKIRRKVVKAQMKLAELVALLDGGEEVQSNKNEEELDDESDSEHEAGFDLEYGRSTMAAAIRCLNQAMKEWSEST